ncbi:MAG TPA: nickel-dependent lactate racemase [Candidatus Latescibacteria bacterium]|nr:nickel-dependent lactate racemase [Candidatus Latescibacterota bacterium]
MRITLRYGEETVSFDIPDKNLLGTLSPRRKSPVKDLVTKILESLERPIGSPPLGRILKPGDRIAILVDDHTRTTPTREFLPPLLGYLREHQVKEENTVIVFACGTHKGLEKMGDKIRLLGREVIQNYRTVVHGCDTDNVYIGETSRSTPIYVNRWVYEADRVIATGNIDLHYFAGYGGGRKSILPGVCSRETIMRNHSLMMSPQARTGNLEGNPVHLDMMEAAERVGVDFLLNVVCDGGNNIVDLLAGDWREAFHQGIGSVDEIYKIPINEKADVVFLSPGGYPYDINLFLSFRAIEHALNAVRKGGTLVCWAECRQGAGNETYRRWMEEFSAGEIDTRKLQERLNQKFELGGYKTLFHYKALDTCEIYLRSSMKDDEIRKVYKLKPFEDFEAVLQEIKDRYGPDFKSYVLPNGVLTLPLCESSTS